MYYTFISIHIPSSTRLVLDVPKVMNSIKIFPHLILWFP